MVGREQCGVAKGLKGRHWRTVHKKELLPVGLGEFIVLQK